MAGLAAVTSRIQLFATCAVLDHVAADRRAHGGDDRPLISQGGFGINIISGWQRREYTQMGDLARRQSITAAAAADDYCAEYVAIMRELWATGRSDLQRRLLPDGRLPPPTVAAERAHPRSSALRRATLGIPLCRRKLATHTCVRRPGQPTPPRPPRARHASRYRGERRDRRRRRRGAPAADDHRRRDRRRGDGEVGAAGEGRDRPSRRSRYRYVRRPRTTRAAIRTRSRCGGRRSASPNCRTNQGVFVGSCRATVARMLDEMAAVPGVRGVMLTFDDFLVGMEQFGQRIQPLMKCRAQALAA